MRRTRAGIDYPVADPGEITFDVDSYEKQSLQTGWDVHHLYLKCNDLPDLPLDANPREPTENKVVRAMQETLTHAPLNFVAFNNGITTIGDDVDVKEGEDGYTVTVDFPAGYGVCNGGHTYLAVKTRQAQLDPSAMVHVEILELPSGLNPDKRNQLVVEIADRRNTNAQLKSTSQADQLDYYETMKRFLADSKNVIWHEGDSEAHDAAMDATHFIRTLKAMDPLRFKSTYARKRKSHADATKGGAKLHSEWMKDMAAHKAKYAVEESDEEE